jgi:formate/nitrite transporter
MSYKTPPEITEAAIESGTAKAGQPLSKTFVGGIMAGAYIAFGGLLAIVTTAGADPKSGSTVLITGAVFTVGLMLVVIAGAELATGNMATSGIGVLSRRVSIGRYSMALGVALIGNLIGSLIVAYFIATKSGVLTQPGPLKRLDGIAMLKGHTESDWQIFLRAVGCNWLVCLAVWMALGAEDIGGKILAIFFPIMAFVAMGFDHVVANMFFLPAAIFAHVPSGIDWGDAVKNWVFAFLGNMVGASVFVAGGYWYLFGRKPAAGPGTGVDAAPQSQTAAAGNGAVRERTPALTGS